MYLQVEGSSSQCFSPILLQALYALIWMETINEPTAPLAQPQASTFYMYMQIGSHTLFPHTYIHTCMYKG